MCLFPSEKVPLPLPVEYKPSLYQLSKMLGFQWLCLYLRLLFLLRGGDKLRRPFCNSHWRRLYGLYPKPPGSLCGSWLPFSCLNFHRPQNFFCFFRVMLLPRKYWYLPIFFNRLWNLEGRGLFPSMGCHVQA